MEEVEEEKSVIVKSVKDKMENILENVKSNFDSTRTERADPAMLDEVQLEYYGSSVSLQSIAQITTSDAETLVVVPHDRSTIGKIEKAIVSSLGLSTSSAGNVIRVIIPRLTAEQRKELSKVAEEGKVALRNITREGIEAFQKLEENNKISEDNAKDLLVDLQKLTDEYSKKLDSLFKQKEALLTV